LLLLLLLRRAPPCPDMAALNSGSVAGQLTIESLAFVLASAGRAAKSGVYFGSTRKPRELSFFCEQEEACSLPTAHTQAWRLCWVCRCLLYGDAVGGWRAERDAAFAAFEAAARACVFKSTKGKGIFQRVVPRQSRGAAQTFTAATAATAACKRRRATQQKANERPHAASKRPNLNNAILQRLACGRSKQRCTTHKNARCPDTHCP
jgi:hypothetical protein